MPSDRRMPGRESCQGNDRLRPTRRRFPRGPPDRPVCGPGTATHPEKGTPLTTKTTFAELGVLPTTVAALEAAGITHPFPIQALTLPVALHGHDIIGQAKTGTGKTLGFTIPLLQRVIAAG